MKHHIWFGVAAGLIGGAIACIEIGVAQMITAKADESWERVTKADANVTGER
jgi:hypothetical protein